MRIISETNKEETITCLKCDALIGFEDKDTEVGEFGCLYITCPKCKEKIWLDNGVKLTYENIEYPRHFHFPENAMPVSDEEIHEAVKNIVKNIGENYFYIGLETGDSLVFGINWEDGIEIFVCKNPASTMLFKEVEADF